MATSLFTEEFLRKVERLTLIARRAAGSGSARADRRGGKTEFADHRRYAPGDDLRYADWHLYGRLGRLFLKEFAREEDAEVLLVLDTSGSMVAKIENALRLSAALLTIALCRGDRARVGEAADGRLRLGPVFEGEGRRAELLDRLASVVGRAGGSTDLAASLRRLPPRRGPGRRVLLVISDLLTESDGRREIATASGDAVVFHWLSPADRRPEASGRLRLVSAEGGGRVIWVGAEEVRAYEAAMNAHREEVAGWLRRRGVRYLYAPAEKPAEDYVLEVLVKEGLVE